MNNIVKYRNNGIDLDARIEDGQAWLTYEQTAELFGIDESVAGKHVRDVIADGELSYDTTTARFAVVRNEGNRTVIRDIVHVNQDMVLHVGYRVRSERGSEFRRWATMVLKGEAEPLAKPKPLTNIQVLLLQVQAMADMEARQLEQEQRQLEQAKRVANTEAGLAALQQAEARRSELEESAGANLLALPPATIEAPNKTQRALINEAVRLYAVKNGGGKVFGDAWRKIYRELYSRCSIDVRKQAKNRGVDALDIVESKGLLEQLYAIALEVLV